MERLGDAREQADANTPGQLLRACVVAQRDVERSNSGELVHEVPLAAPIGRAKAHETHDVWMSESRQRPNFAMCRALCPGQRRRVRARLPQRRA